MSITDELREWAHGFNGPWRRNEEMLLAIADRIDEAHESACAEAYGDGVMSVPIALDESAWVKLPVDADGEPIHIGDVMDGTCPSGKHVNGTVSAIGDGVFWLSNVQFSLKPDYMHHYHAPTVEDVLRDYASRILIAGCIDEEDELVAEYAAKLRLAESEDA